jgi:SAM-dependent methyltransferase
MTSSARYDAVADFYDQFSPDVYEDPATAALLELIGDVSGLRVLDLACGQGRLTREMARRGARVVGADISARLLDIARARESERSQGISYVRTDAASPDTLAGETFDGVACSFGLSDVDDLDGAIATVTRVLRPGGFFAFSILHPCFPGWATKQASPSWNPERGYYQEGWWRASSPAHGLRPKVGANHRMLSTYLNALARHGLVVGQTVEPPPSSDWLAEPPPGGPCTCLSCRALPAQRRRRP